MTRSPQISAIYLAPSAGAPMQALAQAKLIPGEGIEGDRYAIGMGAFSQNLPPKIRHISLITQTGIAIANEWLEASQKPSFSDSETRRNIVLSNIAPAQLNQLVGKIFFLGGIAFKGLNFAFPAKDLLSLLINPILWMPLKVVAAFVLRYSVLV